MVSWHTGRTINTENMEMKTEKNQKIKAIKEFFNTLFEVEPDMGHVIRRYRDDRSAGGITE